jgi:hypothetical protein
MMNGACLKKKNLDGWTIMDEAIAVKNTRMLGLIFDVSTSMERDKWMQ